jgi:hypothetical protein
MGLSYYNNILNYVPFYCTYLYIIKNMFFFADDSIPRSCSKITEQWLSAVWNFILYTVDSAE